MCGPVQGREGVARCFSCNEELEARTVGRTPVPWLGESAVAPSRMSSMIQVKSER
jgi:hypothetical protein